MLQVSTNCLLNKFIINEPTLFHIAEEQMWVVITDTTRSTSVHYYTFLHLPSLIEMSSSLLFKTQKLSNLPYRAKLCRAKFSSGETIRRAKFSSLKKNSSLSPDKKFRPIRIKVSLIEVHMNLRGKKVIKTNFD